MNKILIIKYIIILVAVYGCNENKNFQKPISTSHIPIQKEIKIFNLSHLQTKNRQSPINLNKNNTTPSNHSLSIHINKNLNAVNIKHHTIELEFHDDSYIEVNNKHYLFKQLHFHTPSEHSINNSIAKMEMHIVSVFKTEEMPKPNYLVMGFLFKEGQENKFIKTLLQNIPRAKQHSYEIPTSLYNPVDLDDLFDSSFEDAVDEFYYYNGSLTTYPFTETVNWYILNTIIEASKDQISSMQKQMGNNAREIK